MATAEETEVEEKPKKPILKILLLVLLVLLLMGGTVGATLFFSGFFNKKAVASAEEELEGAEAAAKDGDAAAGKDGKDAAGEAVNNEKELELHQELGRLRLLRAAEEYEDLSIVSEMIQVWERIKLVRERQGYVSTKVKLTFKKQVYRKLLFA